MHPKDRQRILIKLSTAPARIDEFPGLRKAISLIAEEEAPESCCPSHYKEISETLAKRLEDCNRQREAAEEALDDCQKRIRAQDDFIQRQHKDSTEKFNEIRDLKFQLAKSAETVNVQENKIHRLERDIEDMQRRINHDWQVRTHLETTLRDRDREITELKTAALKKKWGRKR